ncbi:PIG-L deacetylase family protein, partial [Crocosphaera watsonii]|uniref:PIG-L deacetylase family protein n=1 Tax=Crocosphaera watsonii TaxID=263511 RepID=UPI000651BAAA
MNVLVVAAHPDDEVLGCGGTIAKHAQAGDHVHILIVAEGVTSRDYQRDLQQRQQQLSRLGETAEQAKEILGAKSLTLGDFPDNRLDSCDLLDIVKVVESIIAQYQPHIIYTHHCGDLNIDHRRVHQAVITAARPLPDSSTKTLLFFEIPSSTEWQIPGSGPSFFPNWFVDISSTLSLKIQALETYNSEMRPYPHPRSFKAVKS